MRRSKNQAVYRFLPGIWVSNKGNSYRTTTAEIKYWNYRKMDNIYLSFISKEILRQIQLFAGRGGDVSGFRMDSDNPFEIVEPACNEGVPDVIGNISPLLFYCASCHHIVQKRTSEEAKNLWTCPYCNGKNIKQLQMVYTCECGHAEAIKAPFVKGVSREDLLYKPNETPYKMFYKMGLNEHAAEFSIQCPNCGKYLLPDNAESSRNYKPFSLSIINLVNKKSGDFYEKGLDAQKIVVARWFGSVSNEQYLEVLDNVELAFSDEYKLDSQRQDAEKQARGLIAAGIINEEQFEQTVNNLLQGKSDKLSAEGLAAQCDKLFPNKMRDQGLYDIWIGNIAYRIMQYDTIKYAKNTISQKDIIAAQKMLEYVDDEEEIIDLHKKLGIVNVQVSSDIEIINCTYGYTRRIVDPNNNTNKNARLKLNSFAKSREGDATLSYGAKLETEGLLFEIDQAKIVEWLNINGIVDDSKMPDLDDEVSVKKWFMEYVKGDILTSFGGIDEGETITKNVFSLLHSMAHAFLKTSGEICGLGITSLTEIIIVETASIFIYAQSSQGIPLGALSGMAENNYMQFLEKSFKDNKMCIYDPICLDRDDSKCNACLILPEICCKYFNNDLGRKYLYTYNNSEERMGFWEM